MASDTDTVVDACCFSVAWRDETWTPEELKKAVEVVSAMAYWLGANAPGTPIPDWCYLATPIDREELLECWDAWQAEKLTREAATGSETVVPKFPVLVPTTQTIARAKDAEPRSEDTPRRCPECGSADLKWASDVHNTGTCVDGRIRMNEVRAIFTLGCEYCSETVLVVPGDVIAAQLTNELQTQSV